MKLILLGGFLGSGKTTAIQQACSLLLKQNKRIAVITNDQGDELVDSKFIKGFDIPVKEVTNGCFCCNYNDLLQNIYALNGQVNPEIIFAESVGSCTDIIATIAKPLTEMHPEFETSISVFADIYLLHSILSGTSSFINEDVQYIFKKQLEEADILVLNKTDLVTNDQLNEVLNTIKQEYASKKILLQNSLNENDIQQWINCFEAYKPEQRKSLDIDYNIYGSGEAKLAWLDAVLSIQTQKLSAAKASALLAEFIYEKIKKQNLTIGHLKFLIDDGFNQTKISFTTSDQPRPQIINGNSLKASVIVNARVQTEPEILEQVILDAIEEISLKTNCKIKIQSLSAFQPGFPRPVHRVAD